jgi:zinc protease
MLKRIKLDNGLKICIENIKCDYSGKNTKPVNIGIGVRYGTNYDEKLGEAHLLEHMLLPLYSNELMKYKSFANAYTHHTTTTYVASIGKDFKHILNVLFKELINPSFSKKTFKKEKERVLYEILMCEDNPPSYLRHKFLATMYGNYVKEPSHGSFDAIKNADIKDMIDIYEKYYTPNNMLVYLATERSKKKIVRDTEKFFCRLNKKNLPSLITPPIIGKPKNKEYVEERRGIKLSYLYLGFRGVGIGHKDFPVLYTVAKILSPTLEDIILEEKGLAYSVDSDYYVFGDINSGHFSCGMPTSVKNVKKIKNIITKEIKKLKEQNIKKENLEVAKRAAISDYESIWDPSALEGIDDITRILLRNLHYHPRKFKKTVKEITPEDIRLILEKYFEESKCITALLKPKK